MEKYYLNYNNFFEREEYDSIEECMEAVEPAYTQKSITIENKKGECLYLMHWWGVRYDPEVEEEPPYASYGDFGYYSNWVQL